MTGSRISLLLCCGLEKLAEAVIVPTATKIGMRPFIFGEQLVMFEVG